MHVLLIKLVYGMFECVVECRGSKSHLELPGEKYLGQKKNLRFVFNEEACLRLRVLLGYPFEVVSMKKGFAFRNSQPVNEDYSSHPTCHCIFLVKSLSLVKLCLY